jgi:peptide-methionine (S)-S-oxide reductase
MSEIHEIGLGGGCHWCTEAVFQSLKGVLTVQQGWIASSVPNQHFSEAILISFDSTIIEVSTLIEIHLLTHASTSDHSFRGKYRSAVYYKNKEDAEQLQRVIAGIQQSFTAEIVTQILPLAKFKMSSAAYLNYYQTRPDAPFCETYISPKLALLKKKFSSNYQPI